MSGCGTYDVFLSFRGKDTRTGFTSHLRSALSGAGIHTFMDNTLLRGNEISGSLSKAIESSRFSVVVFSPNYADSRWCMLELEEILRCRNAAKLHILPVFYHLDPRDVRNQTGAFGNSFQSLINRFPTTPQMVERWRGALKTTGNLGGWTVDSRDEESWVITQFVDHLSEKVIDYANLFVADYPVGMESYIKEFISILQNAPRTKGAFIAGLWGMGGIGKTSLASAIFNELSIQFNRKSFIANVREAWEQGSGCILQKQLVSDILRDTSMKISSINRGKTIIEKRLCYMRALILLDDVNDMDQLKALCGNRNWFGPSSIIIITTRDVSVLENIEADYIRKMEEMNNIESSELFSWHAFKQPSPNPDFVELSFDVVAYCGGLPLALEVLGSYLSKRPKPQWEDVLSKLKRIPNEKINEKLKISFDGLSDYMEKDIFLDICCFFIGKKRDNVTIILNGCGLHAEIGIAILMERSLVKVDKNNKLRMHDLLRDMGREIIREKPPKKLGERSRIWLQDDVIDVLKKNIGTNEVKGLALRLSKATEICLPATGFKKMNGLRLLLLGHVKISGNYDDLFEGLKWLSWLGFPSRFISGKFYKGSFVGIDLRHSNLKQFWNVPQFLPKLKVLNLSHSRYLKRTPDFLYMPNLERLILKDCPSLSKIHKTIGELKNLHMINLKDCEHLGYLPKSFYKLRSLENLILSGCSKINKLEEDIEQMESLTTLVADNTAVTRVPYSIVRLKNIKYISLCGYEGLSHEVFPSLISSWISPLNVPRSLAQEFGYNPYQLSVDVQSNDVYATKCLEMKPSTSTSQIFGEKASELCISHNQISYESCSDEFLSSLMMEVGNCKILQGWAADKFVDPSFPCNKHPNWPRYSNEGERVSFKMPQIDCNLEGMILCIDYPYSQTGMTSPFPFTLWILNNTKTITQIIKRDTEAISEEEEAQGQDIIANLECGDEIDIAIVFGERFSVKKTTVYLIYGDSFKEQLLSTPDRNAVVSCEEKTSEKRFYCFLSGFCGCRCLGASGPSYD